MIPVFIDTRGISEQFDLTREDVNNLIQYSVQEVASEFARLVEQNANNELSSSRRKYKDNIIVGEEGRFAATVSLVGWLPNAVESGMGAFDMKSHFRNSDKAKRSKSGGWYLTIPFRGATSDALGESDLFQFKIPKSVEQVVKSKRQSYPTAGGGRRSRGLRREEIPNQHQEPKIRPALSNLDTNETFEAYTNKTSIFEGLTRQKDSNTGDNVYMSFRRVSDKSEPESWIHPGIQAYNLFDKAEQELNIPNTIGDAIDGFLEGLGYE